MKRAEFPSAHGFVTVMALLLVCFGMMTGCPAPAGSPRFSIIMIHDADGHANGVNGAGTVVGDTSFNGGDSHAFVWKSDGTLIDLGTLGGRWSEANGVNDYDDVTGTSWMPQSFWHAFYWTADGGMKDLGTLGGNTSTGLAISGKGVIAGDSGAGDGYYHAFKWNSTDGMQSIPGAEQGTHAFGINLGEATAGSVRDGSSFDTPYPPDAKGWYGDGTEFNIVNTFGGKGAMAMAINDGGTVVGVAAKENGDQHAYSWNSPGPMVDLPTLGGIDVHFASGAESINFFGDIVGVACIPNGVRHAVLWKGGKIYDLTALIPAGTNWKFLEEANCISNNGLIVGTGHLQSETGSFESRPYLLVPVRLKSLTVDPASVKGKVSTTGTITLTDKAPIPIDVAIQTDIAGTISLPGQTVRIPKDNASAGFTITTNAVGAGPVAGHVTGSYGGVLVVGGITVTP